MYDDFITEIKSRNWNEPLVPYSNFFERFTVPRKDLQVISNRVLVNSHIYQSNYLLICGTAFLIYVLWHPSSVFVVGVILAAFVYTKSPTPLVVNGRLITRRDRYRAFALFSAVVLVLTGVLSSIMKVLSLCLCLVLSHACFRHTNIRYKATHFRTQPADSW